MAYLGSWKIDDYVNIPVTTHKFSTGAAFAPTVLTYSIYEDATAVGLDEDVDMTVASPFDSVVGFYLARRQLTAAAGFEKGKNYTVLIKATVDSVSAITAHTFQIEAEVDANAVSDKTGYALANDAITAAVIATDAIDADAIKADAITEIQAGLATPTNITAGTITTVTNLTNLPTMPADWVTASGLKADAVTEIQSGLALEATLTAIKGAGWTTETLAAIDVLIDAIKAKTDNLPASPAAVGSAMTLADDAITSAKFDESTAYPLKSADTGVTAVARVGADGDTLETLSDQIDNLDADVADVFDDVGDVKAELDLVFVHTGTNIPATLTAIKGAGWTNENLTTIDANVDAVKAKTDNLPSDPADQSAVEAAITAAAATLPSAEDIMTSIVEGAITLRDSLKLANAFMAGKVSGGNTASIAFRDLADALDRIVMTVDVDGNRTGVTRNLA